MAVLAVDPHQPQAAPIERAAAVIREGGLVAFPTETVYGLGAAALEPRAVARIYAAKGRPSYNPLIVHVLDASWARELVEDWPPLAATLADAFWPGPLTVILPKRAEVPDLVTAGLDTVALRAPAHPVARALLAAAGRPIAAPSANRFQGVSPTTAAHVRRSLGEDAALILDAGPTPVGIESTVLDLSGERPTLLRPGGLPIPTLEALTGPLTRGTVIADGLPRASPGMVERHYAPDAHVHILGREDLVERLAAPGHGGLVGALVMHADTSAISGVHALSMPDDPLAYGRMLYAALHTLEELGCATILIESVPDPAHDARWAGVADRLARAAR
ncbi:threonylcarbamoyl-AMP synthase [Pseudenhygromyxa sp. WMMC2535]|uniref:L-threonylcarbamoyladenylate synthase n=1 Tax=Pseudenhygromyxa sp. WMMC2535 TaxID=2712867 RepID=UPI001553D20D|nr:L-threonylcarbamoyladenylate synthase [Pseudenhygromyxa sp. WMMC2535]NVB37817.1 threonylcarbamoyl-AMP synthase [Pseudenhygromyxa sp. WMMC2535]